MNDIKATQNRLLRMAKCVHSILEDNSIPYVITYGTLLGSVRHKGFIPWDDDFDIYLFDDTYNKAIDALSASLPTCYFVENEETEPLYFHGWSHVKDLNSTVVCQQFPQDNIYAHHGLSIDLYKATLIPRERLYLFQTQERLNYLTRKHIHGFITDSDFIQNRTFLETQINAAQQKDIQFPDDLIYGFMSLDGDYLEIDEVFPIKKYLFEGLSFNGPNHYHDFLTRCYGNYLELPPVEKRIPHYSHVTLF